MDNEVMNYTKNKREGATDTEGEWASTRTDGDAGTAPLLRS